MVQGDDKPKEATQKPDKPKEADPRADKPKEVPKGMTAKLVMRGKVPDQIDKVELDLVLTNDGDQEVRICTRCSMTGTHQFTGFSLSLFPNDRDSSISPKEIESKTVLLKPGESVSLPIPKLSEKTHAGPDGKYKILASYSVSKEFAEGHKTWQGHLLATTLIELAGGAKPIQERIPSEKIKPGDWIYIHVTNTLPDNPIRASYHVETTGKVALGAGYGRVMVADLTPEQAEAAIQKSLGSLLKKPEVSVSRRPPTPVNEGTNAELERRVQQLEKEVRTLHTTLEELQKKSSDK